MLPESEPEPKYRKSFFEEASDLYRSVVDIVNEFLEQYLFTPNLIPAYACVNDTHSCSSSVLDEYIMYMGNHGSNGAKPSRAKQDPNWKRRGGHRKKVSIKARNRRKKIKKKGKP